MTGNGVPMRIETSLKRGGTPVCIAEIKGVRASNPRTLIKRLVTFGTFNPRSMLEKTGRKERLLQLIPIYIKHRDLIMPKDDPNEENQLFPIHDPNAIDFSKHAFEVLQKVYKDMYNVRKDINRDRLVFQKGHQEREEQYQANELTFIKNYNKGPEKVTDTPESVMLEAGRLEEKKDRIQEDIKNAEQKTEHKALKIEEIKENKNRIKSQIDEYKNKIKELESKLIFEGEKIEGLVKEKDSLQEVIKKSKIEEEQIIPSLISNREQVNKPPNLSLIHI